MSAMVICFIVVMNMHIDPCFIFTTTIKWAIKYYSKIWSCVIYRRFSLNFAPRRPSTWWRHQERAVSWAVDVLRFSLAWLNTCWVLISKLSVCIKWYWHELSSAMGITAIVTWRWQQMHVMLTIHAGASSAMTRVIMAQQMLASNASNEVPWSDACKFHLNDC